MAGPRRRLKYAGMKALPCLLALLLVPAPAREKPGKETPADRKPAEEVLTLDPVKVHEKPILSFAVDLAVYADPKTKLVTRVFITGVQPNTDAEHLGLQAGDEIVKIDGQPVAGMDAVVAAETPLGKVLLNRRPGEPLKIEVITRRTQNFTLRAQKGSPLDVR